MNSKQLNRGVISKGGRISSSIPPLTVRESSRHIPLGSCDVMIDAIPVWCLDQPTTGTVQTNWNSSKIGMNSIWATSTIIGARTI
jgi:hypothetical protein